MAKKISADTITAITSSPDFSDPKKVGLTPTPEQIIQQIRSDLQQRVEAKKKKATGATVDLSKRFNDAALVAENQKKHFEQMLQDVPEGFKLVPVFYSKIDQARGDKIRSEYSWKVRHRFLRFLAENHTDELLKLGIDPVGVARMKKGLDPTDAHGNLYQLNVDHIIELGGSGYWAQASVPDPLNGVRKSSVNPANHFDNFILLPEHVHEYKNSLNRLQGTSNLKPGESKWILMMVPESNQNYSGFVCPPQAQNHPLQGVYLRPKEITKEIDHSFYVTKQASTLLQDLRKNATVEEIVTTCDALARQHGKPLWQVANDNTAEGLEASKRVAALLAKDPAAKTDIEEMLEPALKEVGERLLRTFNHVAKQAGKGKGAAAYSHFRCRFNSKMLQRLRADTANLPFKAAVEFQKTMDHLERELAKTPSLPAQTVKHNGHKKPRQHNKK